MDIRVLRYFLAVAKEQSFTKGAEQLHITQPTLSRQLAALEEELRTPLFIRSGRNTIGCGEFAAVETLAQICRSYKEKYPLVQIAIHTATADTIYEMMSKGLVDIGLFLEPVSTEGLDYIRINGGDHWVVSMCPDDPMASKVLRNTGGKICLYREDCYWRYLQTR